jgi:hypothetical protein
MIKFKTIIIQVFENDFFFFLIIKKNTDLGFVFCVLLAFCDKYGEFLIVSNRVFLFLLKVQLKC